jgi:hypothetical protein
MPRSPRSGGGILNVVVACRLEKWPHGSRAEAARMRANGTPLAEVLRRYPEALPDGFLGRPVEPARRATYAHYALLQELQGEPDVDPADSEAVEQILRPRSILRSPTYAMFSATRPTNRWPTRVKR